MSLALILPLHRTAVTFMNFIFLTLTALIGDTDKLKGLPEVTQDTYKKEHPRVKLKLCQLLTRYY